MRICLIALLATFPIKALSWGQTGQAVTVKIAESFLTEVASNQLAAITGGTSLAELASWADSVRNTPEWSQTSVWHYVNLEKSSFEQSPQDILQALDFAESELVKSGTNEQKLIWVKFIIHFIGDLHQPLHTGKSSDRGGNSIKLSFKGRKTNLHALWDGVFIQNEGSGTAELAQKIIDMRMSQGLLNLPFDPSDVVQENSELLDFVYSFQGQSIDEAYANKAKELTQKRLWAGGLRLASQLNQLFK